MMYRPFAGVCGALLLLASPVPAQRAMPAADASLSDTLRLSLEDAVESGLRVADEIRLAHAPQVSLHPDRRDSRLSLDLFSRIPY